MVHTQGAFSVFDIVVIRNRDGTKIHYVTRTVPLIVKRGGRVSLRLRDLKVRVTSIHNFLTTLEIDVKEPDVLSV